MGSDIISHPLYLAEMSAAEPVGRAAERGVDASALIVEVKHGATKVIIVEFQAYKVAFANFLAVGASEVRQAVFLKGPAGLVLVVVAVTLGIVQGCVQSHILSKALIEQQLQVMLCKVVALVGIICRSAVGSRILSAWIISAAILLHLLFAGIVPGHIGAFMAAECKQAQQSVVGAVGQLPPDSSRAWKKHALCIRRCLCG